MVLSLVLLSPLVSGVLGVPLVCMVALILRIRRLIAVAHLRRLQRELEAIPQIVAASLIERVQLKHRQ